MRRFIGALCLIACIVGIAETMLERDTYLFGIMFVFGAIASTMLILSR